jgi:glutamate-1-semialdehyde aminotransferase
MPGGYNSANRAIEPAMAIRRASGAYFEDSEGQRYIDYHAEATVRQP